MPIYTQPTGTPMMLPGPSYAPAFPWTNPQPVIDNGAFRPQFVHAPQPIYPIPMMNYPGPSGHYPYGGYYPYGTGFYSPGPLPTHYRPTLPGHMNHMSLPYQPFHGQPEGTRAVSDPTDLNIARNHRNASNRGAPHMSYIPGGPCPNPIQASYGHQYVPSSQYTHGPASHNITQTHRVPPREPVHRHGYGGNTRPYVPVAREASTPNFGQLPIYDGHPGNHLARSTGNHPYGGFGPQPGRDGPHGSGYQSQRLQEAYVPAVPGNNQQMIHGKWCLNPS